MIGGRSTRLYVCLLQCEEISQKMNPHQLMFRGGTHIQRMARLDSVIYYETNERAMIPYGIAALKWYYV